MSIEDFLHPLWKRSLELDKDNLNTAMLHEIQKPLSQAEQDIIASRIQLSVDTATSYWLDYWGSWLGLHRINGWTDDEYREHLKHHVLHPRNTISALQQAVADFLNTDKANIHIYEPFRDMLIWNKSNYNSFAYFPSTYYRYAVIDVQIDAPYDKTVAEIINLFRPAGVIWVITSKINSFSDEAPIIPMGIRNARYPFLSYDTNYAGFESRDTGRIVPSLDNTLTVDDPFIYNDNESLLNEGKKYAGGNSNHNNVASVGQLVRSYTPLGTDEFSDTRAYVEQLTHQDRVAVSTRDNNAKTFTLSPSKLNLVQGTNDNSTLKNKTPNSIPDADSINLLTGTTNYSSNWTWNVTPSIDGSQVPNILHYPKTTISSGLSIIADQNINDGILQPSTTYTASFYAKGTGRFIFYCYPSVGVTQGDNNAPIKLSSSFQLYTITFTTVSNLSGDKNFLLRQDYSPVVTDQNTVEAYVYGMKLEKGSVATDWCPNIKDSLVNSLAYKGYLLDASLKTNTTYDIGLTGYSSTTFAQSNVKFYINGNTPISAVLKSSLDNKSTWYTASFTTPEDFVSDRIIAISLEGIDSAPDFAYSNLVIREHDNTKPLYYSMNKNDTQKDYGLTGIYDVKGFINTYKTPLDSNATNQTINDMFSSKNMIFTVKSLATTNDVTIKIQMYNFKINMWVTQDTQIVTKDYKDIMLTINDITPYLNDNGVLFYQVIPETKNYLVVNYLGLSVTKRSDTPDTSYLANQNNCGAEILDVVSK